MLSDPARLFIPIKIMENLPTSGHEEIYGDKRWFTERGVRNNNCYAYAMDHYRPHRNHKSVVGDVAGYNHDITYDTCGPLKERILKDNPGGRIYPAAEDTACGPGFYKIMMFAASSKEPGGYGDFHFFKQHKDILYTVQKGDTVHSVARFFGLPASRIVEANKGAQRLQEGDRLFLTNVNVWSHKLGWATSPLLTDSCKKVIKDPRHACLSYSMTYNQYCGAYCVKAGHVKTSRL